jgi:O-antigen ligase/cytochrome c-type biogenesis protein CcmH/NrfG
LGRVFLPQDLRRAALASLKGLLSKRVFLWLALSLVFVSVLGRGGESISAALLVDSWLLLLTILWLISLVRGGVFRGSGFDGPIWGFLFLCALSYTLSSYPYASQIELKRVLLYIGFFCGINGLLDFKGRRTLLTVIVIVGVLEAVLCLFQYYALGAPRGKGTFFSPNLAATYLVGCIAIGVGMALWGRGSSLTKAFWVSTAVLCIWATATTGSRSALVSLAFLLAGLVALGKVRGRWLLVGLGALMVLLAVDNPIRERVFFAGYSDMYANQRPRIWAQSLKMLTDSPLLGVTLGNFKYASVAYQFPVEGSLGRYSKVFTTADNGFLEIAAETGIPGILCMVWGAVVLIRLVRRGRRAVEGTEEEPQFFAACLILLALASQTFFHKVYHSPPSMIMGIVALSIVTKAGRVQGRDPGFLERLWPRGWRLFQEPSGGRVKAILCTGGAVVLLLGVWPFLCLAPYLGFNHYEKAAALQAAGDLDGSEEQLQMAISYNPRQAFFHHRLGNIHMEKFSLDHSTERARAALEAFRKAIELNRIHPPFWHTLARYHEFMVSFFQGQEREAHIQQAAMAYEKAIELAPTNPFYRVSLAALFIKAGELEKAIAPLEQALHLEPNFVTAQVLLIDVKEKLGYKEEAAALRAKLEETLRRVSGLRPINEYEARLLMDPARYFKDQG